MTRRGKADRFERVAKKEIKSPWVMNEVRLAMLLRREHQAVLRLAEKVYNWQVDQWADDEDAMHTFIEHLKQRAR